MKKLTSTILLALSAMVIPAGATTVQFTAAAPTTRRVVDTFEGTNVASGSLILAGVFANVGNFAYNPAISVAANVTAMEQTGASNAGFQAFGFTAPGNGAATTLPGNYTLDVNGSPGQAAFSIIDNSTNSNYFNSSQLYIVIFNGTTVGASTEMGVFTSTSWIIPSNTQGTGGDVGTYATSTGTTITAVGNAGSVTGTSGNPGTLGLAAAPEPASLISLIGGGGLLALLRRRRKE